MLDVENEGTILSRYGNEPLNEFRIILTEVYRRHHERLSYYEIDSRNTEFLAAPSFVREYKDQMDERKQKTEATLELLHLDIEEYKASFPVQDLMEHGNAKNKFLTACEEHRITIRAALQTTTSHIRDLFARSVIYSEIRVVREATFESRNKGIFIQGIQNVVDEQFERFEIFKNTLKPHQKHLMFHVSQIMTTAKADIDKIFAEFKEKWHVKMTEPQMNISHINIANVNDLDDGYEYAEEIVTYDAYKALVEAVNAKANQAYPQAQVVRNCNSNYKIDLNIINTNFTCILGYV